MALNRAQIKVLLETGDVPTQAEFAEIIDSLANLVDTNLFENQNTHDQDILLEDAKSIRSKNFGGTLNLSSGIDRGVELTPDNGNFEEGAFFASDFVGGIAFGNLFNDTFASVECKDKSVTLNINGPADNILQAIKITNNAAGTLIKIGFFNQSEVPRPTVTGSRAGNAALASLLTALDSLGLIIDNTTA